MKILRGTRKGGLDVHHSVWHNMTWLRAGLTCLLASAGVNALYSANSAVVQLTDDTFSKKVLTGDALWLVEFYAPW